MLKFTLHWFLFQFAFRTFRWFFALLFEISQWQIVENKIFNHSAICSWTCENTEWSLEWAEIYEWMAEWKEDQTAITPPILYLSLFLFSLCVYGGSRAKNRKIEKQKARRTASAFEQQMSRCLIRCRGIHHESNRRIKQHKPLLLLFYFSCLRLQLCCVYTLNSTLKCSIQCSFSVDMLIWCMVVMPAKCEFSGKRKYFRQFFNQVFFSQK
jgi:Fe-S-cluster containining protein